MVAGFLIKKIHTIKSRLALPDDEYRAMLSSFGVESSTLLNESDALAFISKLESMLICDKQSAPKALQSKRWDSLGLRENMATPSQIRHLEGLFVKVSRQTSLAQKQAAFLVFLKNRFGIERIQWLERSMVAKVKRALVAMESNEEESQ